MGANSTVPVTAGSGVNLHAFTRSSDSRVQQVVRSSFATAVTLDEWAASNVTASNRIAADVNRVGVLIVNNTAGRTYFRFDATVPTQASYSFYLEQGERWEMQPAFTQLPISFMAVTTQGTIETTLATDS